MMELPEAEGLVRSGRVPLDEMRTYGEALKALLAEYDRRGARLSEIKEIVREGLGSSPATRTFDLLGRIEDALVDQEASEAESRG